MKYFRTYPWGFQLLLFVLMVFTLISSATVIVFSLLPKLSGFMPADINKIGPDSPAALINAALVVQAASSLFVFFLPAFLFAHLAHPSKTHYLGLRAPANKINYVLAMLVMLGAMPLLEALSSVIGLINFGPDIKAAQQQNDDTFKAFLKMGSFGQFIKVFVAMAIVPGLGEEFFFRGLLMRFAKQRSRSMVTPIFLSGLAFAFAHSNIYGFLSIFLAGMLLAAIYYLTGSIWCSVLAHIFFNGTQVILAYVGNFNPAVKSFMASTSVSYYAVAGGAAVFGISLYLLLKNKTPLPPNWADDFTPEELRRSENL